MFSCVTITPLGSIVEPEVYWRNKIFEGSAARSVRDRIHEIFRRDPGKAGDVIHVNAGGSDSTSGEIGLERGVIVPAGQDAGRLAILGDVDHLVQGALEAARTGGIDRNGDQAGAHATKEGADHFEARRVGKQKPVAGRETAFFPQMPGDRLRPVEKRGVGVAFDRIAVYVKVRIQEFVRVLICQPIQVV